ncbi:MAG: ATP-binding cassette domain-containing protein [Planctomycetes bacterium]|nr:ATP-binding cassette domain-containing protein [Planctomycetota bacterium]
MITVENLTIQSGDFRLEEISLHIPTGEYGVLMGQTGSGKTTLVECLCGLRSLEKGRIELAGQDVTELRPGERNIGYVPQDGALFPMMTVRSHLALPLSIRKWKPADITHRTDEMAQMLGIEHLLDRLPGKLSGGEIQRVALGRALAFSPTTLVLDEPLSAMDDQTREQMYQLLKNVQEWTQATVLHITHSYREARELADCQFEIRQGRIEPVTQLENEQAENTSVHGMEEK